MELIATYDDFLKNHLENHANRGSGHTNYLSSTIVEELLREMGEHVLLIIIARITTQFLWTVLLMLVILIS